jgi:hypothetical protein
MSEAEPESSEITVQPTKDLQRSIDGFNQPLARYLQSLDLPTENVLYPIDERKRIVDNLKDALSELPYEERKKSHYLTKFTVAIAVGLFDGAINYLWNETISALRRLIIKFDLQYFYSVASKVNSRYDNLSTEDDLEEVGDHDLLEGCRVITFR